ncbi:hypothetical protein [Pseudomonas mangiferae]|uniref:Uncharacterized protein n=1 Tax=Pseudomonas mangiferae TaxID=2593654 RepID=A0A553GYF6_9PSED|nr:hypothetical protein [Pseudomonas mangiferae]TRX74536.1 hypothetical protein FM069_11035 [Pseudomonas mangiferae]
MIPLQQRTRAFIQARYHIQARIVSPLEFAADGGLTRLEVEVLKNYRGNDFAVGDVVAFTLKFVTLKREEIILGGQFVCVEDLVPGRLLEVCLDGNEEPYDVPLDLCISIQSVTEVPSFDFKVPDVPAVENPKRGRLLGWLKRS